MISSEVFRDQPVLTGSAVRLEQLCGRHFADMWTGQPDPEVARLTGSTQHFTREQASQWVASRPDHHDRADWAIVRRQDGVVLGEAVLNDLDQHNASVNFRILLVRPEYFGHGYGTQATRLVVDYALDVIGLHRISLEVYDFNPRAQRVYEKCGFISEGRSRDALYWQGQWHDAIRMSILSTDPRPWRPDGREQSAPGGCGGEQSAPGGCGREQPAPSGADQGQAASSDGEAFAARLRPAQRMLGLLDLAPERRIRLQRRLTKFVMR